MSLLHPSLPPLNRPLPPLNALHFFTKETEEERRLRRELGYSTSGDRDENAIDGEEREVMEVDEVQSSTTTLARAVEQVAVATPTTVNHGAISTVPQTQSLSSMMEGANQGSKATVAETITESVARGGDVVARDSAMEVEVIAEEVSVEMSAPAEPFISASMDKGKAKAVSEGVRGDAIPGVAEENDEDEPLPELDSGSSDEEGEDSEEE